MGATMWVIGQVLSVLTKSTLPENGAPTVAMPVAMAFSQLKFVQ